MEINVTWPDTSNQWYMMSTFYGLLKVDKLKKIKEVILQQKEYIELFEPNDLTPRPTVGEPDSHKTIKWAYQYNFEPFFDPYQKLCEG